MPFGIDDMLIGAGISAGTGLLSKLFSGDSEKSLALKRLRDKIMSLQQLSRAQINTDLNSIDRAAKTTVTGALDQAALSTAGRQNATASIISSIAPGMAQARSAREQQLNDYNRNLETQRAQLESGIDAQLDSDTPQQDLMNVLGLGLQGALTSALGSGSAKEDTPQNIWGPQNANTVNTTGMDLTPIKAPNFGLTEQLTLPMQVPSLDLMKNIKKYKKGAFQR